MFKNAFDNFSLTENGDITNRSTTNPVLDFFYFVPNILPITEGDRERLIELFEKSWKHSENDTVKLLFYVRDILEGAGKRSVFRFLINYISQKYPQKFSNLIKFIPEYGRWDDLYSLFNTQLEDVALQVIKDGIDSDNGLCLKWLPREKKKNHKAFLKIIKFLKISPKEYRKLILSKSPVVVEQQMCKKEWYQINFSHVPSVAMKKYRKAFSKNASEFFAKFLENVSNGTAKINTKAVYPNEIVLHFLKKIETWDKEYLISDEFKNDLANQALKAQWENLRNVFEGKEYSILPVCDVSGSMYSPKRIPISVSVGLSLYFAERNKGKFSSVFLTFSENPQFVVLDENKDLFEKMYKIINSNWGYNTNIVKTLDLLLRYATSKKLPDSEMPKTLLIISDMQFDPYYDNKNNNSVEYVLNSFEEHGYTKPNIIWWNVGSYQNVPVTAEENGVAVITGYNPMVVKCLLNKETYTPEIIVKEIINSKRYENIYVKS
ncbi:MAG: hypothetical protein KatS3mg002_0983 [Candidatus Woesearchaeota archaeon]|nr:MAG: hypothetical protein KatS3mg002_0983 [Candidatus Woesearchaeota archaeon]